MTTVEDRVEPAARALPELADTLTPDLSRHRDVGVTSPRDAHSTAIGITSATGDKGRPATARGLALTVARDLDTPITRVEANPGRPALTRRFGLLPALGHRAVVREGCPLATVARVVFATRAIVVVGETGEGANRLPRQLSQGGHLRAPDGLRDIVMLDLPPITNYRYSRLAASVTAVVALVMRAGVTLVGVERAAIARPENRPSRGVVVTTTRALLPRWQRDGGGL